MKQNSNRPASSVRWRLALGVLLVICPAGRAADFASLCSDRAAIEQVYYHHRTGTKPPFATVLPRAALESLVRLDLKKEAVLRDHYGVTVTPARLRAEVRRIDTTTRAPAVLAQIKAALDNDPVRFAEAFAKPFLVERLLRSHFENDAVLHAPLRAECAGIRTRLLAAEAKGATPTQLLAQLQRADSNAVQVWTWQLTPRPVKARGSSAEQLEIRKRFGPHAELLSPTGAPQARPGLYFDELPAELQRLLRVQLRRPGDVSAVIETPGGFLLYLATEKTESVLSVACLSLPKRDYQRWLDEQKDPR